ncbi:MAG: SDR family NAD(P)-dependent oxidoreductase [bacterium]|nr:SDR family NAD(P)-dependent oxidoreductase [bacterium]
MAAQAPTTVLITGCSTGIGRATAERLAGKGFTVWASARRPEQLADLAAHGCRTVALDVCDEASMRAALATIEAQDGPVGALVNNAGYGQEGAFETTPMAEIRRQFETNVFGLVRLTQLVLPGMRRRGAGRIVNLSSMGGTLTLPGGAYYHATKHALEALSDALRFEVAGFGIQVVVVQPGPIRTAFGDTAIDAIRAAAADGGPYTGFHESLAKAIRDAYDGPMGKLALGPEAVAAVIEKALTAPRPRTRYTVTAAARMMMALRRWLPDRAFDAVLRTQIPPPQPA